MDLLWATLWGPWVSGCPIPLLTAKPARWLLFTAHPPSPRLPALGLFKPVITHSAQLYGFPRGKTSSKKKFLEGESAPAHSLPSSREEASRTCPAEPSKHTILASKSFTNFPIFDSSVSAQGAKMQHKSSSVLYGQPQLYNFTLPHHA